MTFGEKLKLIRIDMGLSQQELATMLNTSKQVISRYELGQTTPKIGVAAKWCEVLGINLDNMLNDSKSIYDEVKPILHDSIVHADTNIIRIAGRDGRYIEKRLTDEQVKALEALIDQLPEAPEDL